MDPGLKRVLKNIAIFAVILAVLITLVMVGLNKYTHHNEEIVVPDVQSLTTDQAAVFLEKKGLRYKVVDSLYVRSQVIGAILEQKPAPGAKVKTNRIIFLTINARSSETVALPDVKDFSQRQAVATLEAMEIRVASINYVPSEFRDLVLDVRYNGRAISAGYKLAKGSYVSLTVGQGGVASEITVPDMKGMSLSEAIDAAHSRSLNLGDIHYDKTPANAEEAKKYRIYKQEPLAGSPSMMGKKIELWMTTDNALIEADEGTETEEAGEYIQ